MSRIHLSATCDVIVKSLVLHASFLFCRSRSSSKIQGIRQGFANDKVPNPGSPNGVLQFRGFGIMHGPAKNFVSK